MTPSRYPDIRDAVRALCAESPAAYHRQLDSQRGYPEAFADALPQAGRMAARSPPDCGGTGLARAGARGAPRRATGEPARRPGASRRPAQPRTGLGCSPTSRTRKRPATWT